MHSSRSLLKHLSRTQDPHSDQFYDKSPRYGYLPQARQIQRRLDQMVHSQQENPYWQQSTGSMHNSDVQINDIRSTLNQLAGTINRISQAQRTNQAASSEQFTLNQQLQTIAKSVADLQGNFSRFRQDNPSTRDIEGLRNAIDQNYQSILSRLDTPSESGIDPDAYARVVESSHADIIEQVRLMQAALQPQTDSSQEIINAVESANQNITSLINQLDGSISGMRQEQNDTELNQIRVQLDSLEHSVSQLATRQIEIPAPDFTNVEARLEEVNRAIVALSSVNHGTDNLDRIEARLIDLSRELDALSASNNEQTAPLMDMGSLETHFSATNSALREIEARLESQSVQSIPELDQLSSELVRLGEKVDNISALSSNSNASISDMDGNSALLERLDQLVERVEQLNAATASPADTADNSYFEALQEQVLGISRQLEGHATPEFSLEPITQSLGNIEQQLGASRDISIELAAGAAEEALRRVMKDLPPAANAENTNDNDLISALHDDLQKLQESLTPALHSDAHFGELKDTLNSIADRISAVEGNLTDMKEIANSAPLHSPDADYQQVEPESQISPDASPTPAPTEKKEKPDLTPGDQLVKAARRAKTDTGRDEPKIEQVMAEPSKTEEPSQTAGEFEDWMEGIDDNKLQDIPDLAAPEMAPNPLPEAGNQADNEYASDQGKDRPLEPGTGGPDLAALVRQANERNNSLTGKDHSSGADFLEAARKAAQAAAMEASATESVSGAEKPSGSKGLMSSLRSMVSKRKKTVVVAVAAALLLVAAMPLINTFTSSPPAVQEAAVINETVQENTAALQPEANQSEAQVVAVADPEEFAPVVSEPDAIDTAAQLENETSPEQTNSVAETISGIPFDLTKVDFVSEPLRLAAEQNDSAAVFEIARRYTNGIGTEKNLEEAARWYEHAANQGYVPAQYLIGNFNEKGIGVPKDRVLAEAWYRQAADNGHVVAMHNLAVMNATPDPVSGKQNLGEAQKWFVKAAEHGVRDSQVNAGIFLAKGTGVPVDLVESYKWFAIAAKSGDTDAAEKRDFIADAMRPDQLEEARKLVDGWKQLQPEPSANVASVPDSWKSNEDRFALLTDQNSIAQAQVMLDKMGFDVGPADGVLGQKTRDAIKNFRAKSGLAVNDKLDNEFMETLKAVSI